MPPRDKEATKKQILQSVKDLLQEGEEHPGINRIAERAGVDKVLIYRYFGGLSGLLSTFAQEHDLWPEFEEIMEAAPYAASLLPPEEFAARFVRGFIREIRERPVTLEALRREIEGSDDLTRSLSAIREERLAELLDSRNADEDSAARYALVAAGLLYLMLLSKSGHNFSSLPLQETDTWERVERAATRLLQEE